MTKDTGSFAYSRTSEYSHCNSQEGMTLRDAFAIAALPTVYKDVDDLAISDYKAMASRMNAENSRQLIARMSYAIADAMLEARKE